MFCYLNISVGEKNEIWVLLGSGMLAKYYVL